MVLAKTTFFSIKASRFYRDTFPAPSKTLLKPTKQKRASLRSTPGIVNPIRAPKLTESDPSLPEIAKKYKKT